MKACIIQPPYSRDTSFSDEYFDYKLRMLDECDESLDIIVLPEYSDVPCATSTKEETFFYHKKYIDILLSKCVETAKRCNAIVFVNALYEINGNYRNTTYAFNRQGELVGKYFKKHLPPLELETLELDSDYTFEFSEPYVLELEGLRYGFLTCYDFYFYEAFANIAQRNVDIIIGCSLQRSDSHDAIETMCRFLAYNTNAYVLRSSVSFSEDSDICGASMAVSPYGKVLVNMKGKFGKADVEFDPRDKYYKPAGFGNPDAAHYEYIEYGRKPWQYRPAGSAIIRDEKKLPYPRVCAYRGANKIAPENSIVAFGAAVALNAQEISLDLFEALSIASFEEVLRKLSCQVIMNIHVKSLLCGEDEIKRIVALLKKYGAEKHCYFTLEADEQICLFKKYASEIPVCVAQLGDSPCETLDRAIEYGCEKVQLCKGYFNRETIEKAHKHGIRCNAFCSDDAKEAKEFFGMGIDTVLTNDCSLVLQCIGE